MPMRLQAFIHQIAVPALLDGMPHFVAFASAFASAFVIAFGMAFGNQCLLGVPWQAFGSP